MVCVSGGFWQSRSHILNNSVYRRKDGISLITRYKDSCLLYGLLTVSNALNIAKSVASKLSSM